MHMAGAGPIPWHVMDKYAERQGYLEDQVLYDDFIYLIRQLDEEFLADQVKRATETTSGKPGGVRPPNGPARQGRYIERR